MARASATRWRWPPESWRGRRSSRWSISSAAATSPTLLRAVRAAHLPDPQRIADVLADRHVRIERVALEHHRDVAVARLQSRDIALADQDAACRRHFEPGEDAQRRRLAAARGPEQRQERAIRHLQIERVQGGERIECLLDAVVTDRAHRASLVELCRMSADGDILRRSRSHAMCRARSLGSLLLSEIAGKARRRHSYAGRFVAITDAAAATSLVPPSSIDRSALNSLNGDLLMHLRVPTIEISRLKRKVQLRVNRQVQCGELPQGLQTKTSLARA